MPPLELCDERIEIRNPAEFPAAPVFRGHDEVRDWRAESFVFDTVDHMRVEEDEIIEAADGETVVMAVRTLGHSKRFEMDYEVPWAAVVIIRHGKWCSAQGYLHKAEALNSVRLRE